MNESNSQQLVGQIIEVADQSLLFRQLAVNDNTPTGAQIAAAAGFKPDQLPVVLLLLENGALEDIRPDEVVNLGAKISRFVVTESDRSYRFTLDGARLEWPCQHITGHAIRKLGGLDDDRKLLLERVDEADLEVLNEQFVNLDESGVESFISRKATWELNVQGKKYVFATPTIIIRDAVVRAGMNPNQGWLIFLKVEGQPKTEMDIDDVIDLRTPGIEKLRLTTRDVDNGEMPIIPLILRREFNLLPSDEQYLDDMCYQWETCFSVSSRWLLIHNYELPAGYNQQKVKLALLITSGYPMNKLDMFFVYPQLLLGCGNKIPATEGSIVIDGAAYQQWSRHRPWNPATDTVISHLAMVDGCFLKEVGQ
jgi:hypothetical protein